MQYEQTLYYPALFNFPLMFFFLQLYCNLMGFLSLAHCLLNFFCTHMFIDTYINKSSNCKRENIWCVEYVFVCVCMPYSAYKGR